MIFRFGDPTRLFVSSLLSRSKPSISISRLTLSSVAQSPLALLRKQTGYAYAMCKKALEENRGDIESARQWLEAEALRSGLQKAEKMQGRRAKEGLVGLLCGPDKALICEINCETDFVTKNENFKHLVANLTESLYKNVKTSSINASDSRSIDRVDLDLEKLKGLYEDLIGRGVNQLGENIKVSRAIVASLDPSSGGKLFAYTHSIGAQLESPVLMGKSASIVALTSEGDRSQEEMTKLGKQICQHVIGLNPKHLGRRDGIAQTPPPNSPTDGAKTSDLDQPGAKNETDEHEDSDVEMEEIIESDTLYDQPLLFDPKVSVREFALANKFHILDFYRYESGESQEGSSSSTSQ